MRKNILNFIFFLILPFEIFWLNGCGGCDGRKNVDPHQSQELSEPATPSVINDLSPTFVAENSLVPETLPIAQPIQQTPSGESEFDALFPSPLNNSQSDQSSANDAAKLDPDDQVKFYF